MNQSGSGERVGATPVLDDDRLEAAEFEQIVAEYTDARDSLAGQHAERSRKMFEGEQTANTIRESSEDVADYVNAMATELYLQYSEQGMPGEEIASEIDKFIASQTRLLLGKMADQRTETVRTHNRFIPKFVGDLYDKFTETWRSWEVPNGDGTVVSRLRETGVWRHLEQKTVAHTRGAKLGRFALTLVTSSINGIENLKYSGARKRLYTMAGIGMLTGATAGAALGLAGAGAVGAFAGAAVSRSAVRAGLGAKLNRDATIQDVALYDRVRMQGRIDQLSSETYSVDELLGYVSSETEKMLHQNNAKLMSGMAIGLAAGLAGNTVARGVGWAANQYIDANFNATAHADVLRDGEATHVIEENAPAVPNHIIEGSSNVANHVIDGERPNHVINGHNGKVGADHLVNDDTMPNHVIDNRSATSKDVADDTHPTHVIDGNSTKPGKEAPAHTFYVENGHGFTREIQDYAKENGYGKLDAVDAYKMYEQILQKHGKNGIIDVHGIKQDTYVENGDVRIGAAGKAHWRSGVENDLDKLMERHENGDRITLHVKHDSIETNHTIDNDSSNRPNHVIGADNTTPTHTINSETEVTHVIEAPTAPRGVIEASAHLSNTNSFTANQLTSGYNRDMKAYYDVLKNVDPRHKADVLGLAAHDLQSLKLTEKVDGVWRFREIGSLPPKAADILHRIADRHNWTLAA